MNFDTALARVLVYEGGLIDNPADPGGITNRGISKRAYPDLDIAHLTDDEISAIYKRDYWDKIDCDSLPFALAFQAFDAAVQHGVGEAISWLAQADDPHKFIAIRMKFYIGLKTWPDFGRGWMNRMATNVAYLAEDL